MSFPKTIHKRGNRLEVRFPYDKETLFDLKLIEGTRFDRGTKLWSLPGSMRAIRMLEEIGFEPKGNVEAFKDYVRGLDRFHSEDCRTVGSLTLFPFQEAGVRFLEPLSKGLLYDDPGVGKTLQAVAWSLHDKNVLVVAPKVVLGQWEVSWADAGRDSVMRPIGQQRGIMITNYERLKVNPVPPYTLIVDEAHYIKNPKTIRSKRVLELGAKAERILAITGSPIINKPIDLWPLYLLLGERSKRDWWSWVQRYTAAFQTPWGWDFSGASYLDELREDMEHFAIRRTKEEVLKDLPPKLYSTFEVEIEKARAKLIESIDEQIFNLIAIKGASIFSGEGLVELQTLRMESALAKVPSVVSLLKERAGSTVVFSAFKEPLRRVAKEVRGTLFTGDQSDAQRAKNKASFIAGTVPVICLTFGAGGVGLDGLQNRADCVILLDLPWTSVECEQAEDRVHRQGQTRVVEVIKILGNSRIEKIVAAALDRKEDIIKQLCRSVR